MTSVGQVSGASYYWQNKFLKQKKKKARWGKVGHYNQAEKQVTKITPVNSQ